MRRRAFLTTVATAGVAAAAGAQTPTSCRRSARDADDGATQRVIPGAPEAREAGSEASASQEAAELLLNEARKPVARSDAACARKLSKWSRTIPYRMPDVGSCGSFAPDGCATRRPQASVVPNTRDRRLS